jgi:uncharacterized protein with PQ loop repeat
MSFKILSDTCAIIGGIMLAFMSLPQIIKMYKTKSANDVSILMFII